MIPTIALIEERMFRLFAILCLSLAIPIHAYADIVQPSHDCFAPDEPMDLSDEFEVEEFNSEVEDYRSCIEDFVAEQEDAIRKHTDAANEAIDEWDSFAASL